MKKLIRLPALKVATGLGRSAIYDRIAKGTMPPPLKIGLRASAWDADEIEAWQRDRLAERDAGKAAKSLKSV